MKAYKGFNKDMTCRGFQFEEGKEYHEENAKLCESGFHACERPLEVFQYYMPSKSVYHEVTLDDVSAEREKGSSKVVAKKIKVGAEIGIKGLVKAQIEWTKEQAMKEGAATSGDGSSAATSGNGSSAATSGYKSSAATSGNGSSAATSGDWSSAATSGEESSAATSGDWSSAATSGYKSSAATSGNGSSAATSGEESSAATSNPNAIALACGKNAKAKGTVGSFIVLTEWNDDATELLTAKLYRIDGKTIKADTWYKLENGELVEVAP